MLTSLMASKLAIVISIPTKRGSPKKTFLKSIHGNQNEQMPIGKKGKIEERTITAVML